MFESRDPIKESQPQFWIDTRRLPKATAGTFYRKLDSTWEKIGFTQGVRELCRPAYADAAKGGRPGIDPAVYRQWRQLSPLRRMPSKPPSRILEPGLDPKNSPTAVRADTIGSCRRSPSTLNNDSNKVAMFLAH